MRTVKDSAPADLVHLTPPPPSVFPGNLSTATAHAAVTVLIVERRAFFRECIVQTLSAHRDLKVHAAASVEEWVEHHDGNVDLILLCSDTAGSEEALKKDIACLEENDASAAVIVLSDLDRVDRVVSAIANGARGFVPADTALEVAISAMKMVSAGGSYVPASSLLAAHKSMGENGGPERQIANMFTSRQIAVIEALRKGKANKTIAYELNMCESTVKVHVRNIMKRLKAKNRTQVAYLAGELLSNMEGTRPRA